jgi:ribosomal protein L34E
MKNGLTDKKIHQIYQTICGYYNKHLRGYGVKLPELIGKEGYTKDALVLVYLAQGYPRTKKATKHELTLFIRKYYPDINDVQQARHLGAQKGWFISAGGRDNKDVSLTRGEYQLVSLEKPYPAFKGHRIEKAEDWEGLKRQYGFRCATCGSKEGEPNIHWPNTITRLQKSHKDPQKPLVGSNIIPQCQKCNRSYKKDWVFDERGRVRKLANPQVIKRSEERIRWAVYKILYAEYRGREPK